MEKEKDCVEKALDSAAGAVSCATVLTSGCGFIMLLVFLLVVVPIVLALLFGG
jgi:hypothetical protein